MTMKLELVRPDFRTIALIFIGILLILLSCWVIPPSNLWFLVVISIIPAVVIFFRPYLGLLLFILLIPLESAFLDLNGGTVTITRLLGVYVFSAWALQIIANRQKVKLTTGLWLFFLFVFWGGLSYLWAENHSLVMSGLQTILQLLALVVLVVNQINTPQRLKTALIVLFIGCLSTTILGLLGIGVEGNNLLLTLQGQGAKEYGSYVGILFVIATILIAYTRGWVKLVALGIVFVSIFVLVANGERGIFLAVGLSWVMLALFSRQKLRIIVLLTSFTVFLYFAPVILEQVSFVNAPILKRMTINSIVETGGNNRIFLWRVGLQIFNEHLILGTGLGNYLYSYGNYTNSFGLDAHNDWLRVAGELGLTGLLIFQTLLTTIGWKLITSLKKMFNLEKKLLVLIIFALFVYTLSVGLTSTYLWRKIYWLVLALAMVTPNLLINDTHNSLPDGD